MILVGLTGGLGSGKSTVARMLEERGAVIVDADDLARRAILPGTPGFDRVLAEFGQEIVGPDGQVNREGLAATVFADDERRRALESITHPEVFRLLMETVEAHRDTEAVVVFDAPLIVETGFADACDVLVVVSAPVEEQVARVARERGMSEKDARARIAAQVRAEEREAAAHEVIRNDGDLRRLEEQVAGLWSRLVARARTTP